MRAAERSLVCVKELVLCKAGGLAEPLPTVGAAERSLVSVKELVLGLFLRVFNAVPRVRALKRLLNNVIELVSQQVGRTHEFLPTHGAGE